MARRSSGGGGGRSFGSFRPAGRSSPPQPQKARDDPPPAPRSSGGSVMGGIGSSIADGMAFGTGNAVAHRAVDAVLGPRTIQHEVVSPATDACSMQSKTFMDCLNGYADDISKCQFYMDMLVQCKTKTGSTMT